MKKYIYESEMLSYVECEEKEIELFEVHDPTREDTDIMDWASLNPILKDIPRENIKSLGKCKVMVWKDKND